jgi:uncharacterized protein (TIGR01244 family)
MVRQEVAMTRHARHLALALLAAVPAAQLWAGVPDSLDASRIPAYRLVRPDLATGGQPSAEALAQLKSLGFATVVNLRTPQEGAAEERAAVEAQGLRYVNVPFTLETFSLADVEAVEKVLADPSAGPVLLHCHSSNRVGAVWAAIQARQGRGFDEALAAGREAGLRSASMIAALRRVLGLPPEPVPAPAPANANPVKP